MKINWVFSIVVLAMAFCAFSAEVFADGSVEKAAPQATPNSAAPAAGNGWKQARDDFDKAAKAAGLDMVRMKKYCDELDAHKSRYSLKDDQIRDTYKALQGLLENKNAKAFCDKSERNKLVEETLHNLAKPTEITQGYHPTCNVTTVEVYLAARHPDVYADLIAQVADCRTYKTKAGESIVVPEKGLLPGEDEKAFDINKPNDNKRCRASQFIQHTLVNGFYQTGRCKPSGTVVGKDYQYILGPQTYRTEQYNDPKYGLVTVRIKESEDKLVDGKGQAVLNSLGKPCDNPNVTPTDVVTISEMVLGYKMPYIDAPYQVTNKPWVFDLPDAARLLKYKQDGNLPLGVPTLAGQHVQTIHDVFVAANGQCWVFIDNQNGEDEDGWVTLQELHKSQQDATYQMKPRHKRP